MNADGVAQSVSSSCNHQYDDRGFATEGYRYGPAAGHGDISDNNMVGVIGQDLSTNATIDTGRKEIGLVDPNVVRRGPQTKGRAQAGGRGYVGQDDEERKGTRIGYRADSACAGRVELDET
ncbi:MAG: hypothetical protein HOH74_29835, partial [Gemmatimonadetes bacterium]|nr:hypothetical protein [Gemmatimonadota bacterium]